MNAKFLLLLPLVAILAALPTSAQGLISFEEYLKASNPGWSDDFGSSVAAHGDTVVIGAPTEWSNATGVNGNELDDSLPGAGAVYVFVRSGSSWTQQAYIKASDPSLEANFGRSVAIENDTLVVGANQGGDEVNNVYRGGAAYVFERTAGVWSQQAKLVAVNAESLDHFGFSVAINSDTIAVGAPGEDSSSAGINGDPSDNSVFSTGAVYVYARSGATWTHQAYLKSSQPSWYHYFGYSLSLSGSTLVVGSYNDTTGGRAFVFESSGSTWSEQSVLRGLDTENGDEFGYSVGICGDTIVVGAPNEDGGSRGVDGDPFDNSNLRSGAAYVYKRSGSTWAIDAYLKASNTDFASNTFGWSVSVCGDRIAVGTPHEASLADGIGGNQYETGPGALSSVGVCYFYRRANSAWSFDAYCKHIASGPDDHFGTSVVVRPNLAVIGSRWDSSLSSGVGGDPHDNSSSRVGSAFIFDLSASTTEFCGPAMLNSSGVPSTLSMNGSLAVADNDFTLVADGLPQDKIGIFLNSSGRAFVLNPGGSQGTLCLGGLSAIGRHNRSHEIRHSGTSGTISLVLDLASMAPGSWAPVVTAGETWHFQAWYRDKNPTATSNFTNGLSVFFE